MPWCGGVRRLSSVVRRPSSVVCRPLTAFLRNGSRYHLQIFSKHLWHAYHGKIRFWWRPLHWPTFRGPEIGFSPFWLLLWNHLSFDSQILPGCCLTYSPLKLFISDQKLSKWLPGCTFNFTYYAHFVLYCYSEWACKKVFFSRTAEHNSSILHINILYKSLVKLCFW